MEELLKKLEEYKENPPSNQIVIIELINTLYEIGKELNQLKVRLDSLIEIIFDKK